MSIKQVPGSCGHARLSIVSFSRGKYKTQKIRNNVKTIQIIAYCGTLESKIRRRVSEVKKQR